MKTSWNFKNAERRSFTKLMNFEFDSKKIDFSLKAEIIAKFISKKFIHSAKRIFQAGKKLASVVFRLMKDKRNWLRRKTELTDRTF